MLPNVQQETIKPIITATVSERALIVTDEYDIYARLPEWGYQHKTVCHSQGEYARDEDGDGFPEVHVNTLEGFWSRLAFLAAPPSRPFLGKAPDLPRILPIRSQRPQKGKGAPRSPHRRSGRLTLMPTPRNTG